MLGSQPRNLIRLAEIDSTQEEIFRRAAAGSPTGTVVTAETQSEGRGRLGRTWLSIAGNIHMSILLAPSENTPTLAAGLALAKALDRFGVYASIKWPNDLLVDDRKIAGILCERRGEVVALGIGVNLAAAPLPESISLRSILGEKAPDPETLIEAILIELNETAEVEEIDQRLYRRNERALHEREEILILGIARNGALRAVKEGKTVEIISGEILFPPIKRT